MSRSTKPKFKYALAESNGYIICVERSDLLVADVASIKVKDNVKFKYGVETLKCVITYLTDDALSEMEIQSKVKPSKATPLTSDVQGKRIRVPISLDEVTSKPSASTTKSKSKNAPKIAVKVKKDRAETHLDHELAGTSHSNRDVIKIDSDLHDDSSASSVSISDDGISPIGKKQGRSHDVRKLMYSTDSSDGSDPEDTLKSAAIDDKSVDNEKKKSADEEVSSESNGGEKRQASDGGVEMCSQKKKRSENQVKAVQIHPSYDVYTLKSILDKALYSSKTASICCRFLVVNVYTEEALLHSSAFGYPPRGKGSCTTQSEVLPRLDPNGLDAIIAKSLEHQVSYKTWRPKMSDGQPRSSITNKVSLAKRVHAVLEGENDTGAPGSSSE